MFRRMKKLNIEYEGINPEPHLQVIPQPNCQRAVFQRCCKNLRFWRRAWRKKKKLFMSPALQPRDFLITSWPEGLLTRLFHKSKSTFGLKLIVEEVKIAIRYCALYTCNGTCFKKAYGVCEGWFKLSSAALKMIILWFIRYNGRPCISHLCHIR